MRVDLPSGKPDDDTHFDCEKQLSLCWTSGTHAVRANLTRYPVVEVTDLTTPPSPLSRPVSSLSSEERQQLRGRLRRLLVEKAASGAARRLALSGVNDAARAVRHKLIASAHASSPTQRALLETADMTGAGVIHCLLLANTEEALDLSLCLVRLCPELLRRVHVDNGGPLCLFMGEGALHIAAVNRREAWILAVLDVAWAHDVEAAQRATPAAAGGKSTADDVAAPPAVGAARQQSFPTSEKALLVRELLFQTCVGPFFSKAPMRTLGGTALAYCAVFNQVGVLRWVARRFRHEIQSLFTTPPPLGGGAHVPTVRFSVLQARMHTHAPTRARGALRTHGHR